MRGGLITLLLTAAALLLVPAAQALAETPHLKVNIVGTGSGVVESLEIEEVGLERGTPPIECSYDGAAESGSCENTPDLLAGEPGFYAEQLNAIPAAGSEVIGWTVENGAPAECPIPSFQTSCLLYGEEGEGIEWEVSVEFKAIPYHLTLYANGPSGSGTVTSSPSGIDCSAGEECAAELAGATTLTAHPASGYAIAGWIGCKQTSAATCSVVPTSEGEEREATAIFIKEGATGPQGNPGATGAAGAQGAQGPQGNPGAAGAAGVQGPQGAAGPQGPAGPKGKVTCKVKQKGKKVKVTCKVSYPKSGSSGRRLRWKLMRGGHAVSHGTSKGALRLNLSHLRSGNYTLHAGGQSTKITIGSGHGNHGAA